MQQFMHYELDSSDQGEDSMLKDRTSVKVAYALYSHQTPEQIVQMFGPGSEQNSRALQPEAKHAQWRQSVATLISNRGGGHGTVLKAIGDGLMASGLPEAAHVCYLLRSEHRAEMRAPDAGLVGATADAAAQRDLDALLMTEVLEYAYALTPTPKGREPFTGFPALAQHKLRHAATLDELGEHARAKKYCEAILANAKGVSGISQVLLSQVHEVLGRISGEGIERDQAGWMGRKLQRPTLDGVWGALEGRLTKFIAGEEDEQGGAPKQLSLIHI